MGAQQAGADDTRPWLVTVAALVCLDVLVIALHGLTGRADVVNLDAEGNVPTWLSSAKLLLIGLCALVAFAGERRECDGAPPRGRLWLGVAALFFALSLDETASLHERAARALMGAFGDNVRATLLGGDSMKDAFAWVVIFAPLAFGALFFLVTFAWSRRARLRRAGALGAAGLACYVVAMALEPAAVFFTPHMTSWGEAERARYRLFSALEESAEIVGTTLLLLTALLYVARVAAPVLLRADLPAAGDEP